MNVQRRRMRFKYGASDVKVTEVLREDGTSGDTWNIDFYESGTWQGSMSWLPLEQKVRVRTGRFTEDCRESIERHILSGTWVVSHETIPEPLKEEPPCPTCGR